MELDVDFETARRVQYGSCGLGGCRYCPHLMVTLQVAQHTSCFERVEHHQVQMAADDSEVVVAVGGLHQYFEVMHSMGDFEALKAAQLRALARSEVVVDERYPAPVDRATYQLVVDHDLGCHEAAGPTKVQFSKTLVKMRLEDCEPEAQVFCRDVRLFLLSVHACAPHPALEK